MMPQRCRSRGKRALEITTSRGASAKGRAAVVPVDGAHRHARKGRPLKTVSRWFYATDQDAKPLKVGLLGKSGWIADAA
jgi:hypothetical protein